MQKLTATCAKENVTMLVTADHGNSDQMMYENGDMHTSHTEAVVPFIDVDPRLKNEKIEMNEGPMALRNVAPTILHIMGINPPPSFEGVSVFK